MRKKVNHVNNQLIDLINGVIEKEIPANENPGKVIDIVEKVLEVIKQQHGNGLKILTAKQILHRLPTALAQVKTRNTS